MRSSGKNGLLAAAALAMAASMPFAGAQTSLGTQQNAPGEILEPPRRLRRKTDAELLNELRTERVADEKRKRKNAKRYRDHARSLMNYHPFAQFV